MLHGIEPVVPTINMIMALSWMKRKVAADLKKARDNLARATEDAAVVNAQRPIATVPVTVMRRMQCATDRFEKILCLTGSAALSSEVAPFEMSEENHCDWCNEHTYCTNQRIPQSFEGCHYGFCYCRHSSVQCSTARCHAGDPDDVTDLTLCKYCNMYYYYLRWVLTYERSRGHPPAPLYIHDYVNDSPLISCRVPQCNCKHSGNVCMLLNCHHVAPVVGERAPETFSAHRDRILLRAIADLWHSMSREEIRESEHFDNALNAPVIERGFVFADERPSLTVRPDFVMPEPPTFANGGLTVVSFGEPGFQPHAGVGVSVDSVVPPDDDFATIDPFNPDYDEVDHDVEERMWHALDDIATHRADADGESVHSDSTEWSVTVRVEGDDVVEEPVDNILDLFDEQPVVDIPVPVAEALLTPEDQIDSPFLLAGAAVPQGRFVVATGARQQAAISSAEGELKKDVETIHNDPESVPTAQHGVCSVHPGDLGLPVQNTDLTTILERDYCIANGLTWASADARWKQLTLLRMPQTLYSLDRAPRGLFQHHAYFRSDFEFTLRLNNCPFACGQLIAVWWPNDQLRGAAHLTFSMASLRNLPHTFLKAGDEHVASLQVPWTAKARVLNPRGALPAGALGVYVWSPLKVGTGVGASVAFSVWAKCVNPRLALKAVPQAAAHQQTLSGLLSDASLSKIAKTVGGVAGFFDSPSILSEKPGENALPDVPQRVNVTDITSDYLISNQNEQFGSIPQLMSLADRCKVPSLTHYFTWSQVHAANTVLWKKTLNPCTLHGPQIAGNQFEMTNIAFYSNWFQFWRGSLEITFEVVATRFHQGQLLIAWSPFPITNPTADQLFGLSTVSLSIGQAGNRTTMRIPYVAPYDQLRTRWNVADLVDNCLGDLFVVVQNPLVAPSNVPSSIEILVYANGGPDFELRRPIDKGDSNTRVKVRGTWQSGQLSDTALDVFRPLDVAEVKRLPPCEIGKDHSDIRVLLRRREFLDYFNTANSDGTYHWLRAYPLRPCTPLARILTSTWAFTSGCMRYYINTHVSNSNVVELQVIGAPDADVKTISLHHENTYPHQFSVAYTNSVNGQWTIFETPTYHLTPYNNTLVWSEVSTWTGPEHACGGLFVMVKAEAEYSVNIFQSAGDDFQLYYPLPVWPCEFNWMPTTYAFEPYQAGEFGKITDDNDEIVMPIVRNVRDPSPARAVGSRLRERMRELGIDAEVPDPVRVAELLPRARPQGWVRDLTCEGVEPNPGPSVLSRPLYDVWEEVVRDFPQFDLIVNELLWQGGWIRDLTREGVEPNPGPCSSKLYIDHSARLERQFNPLVCNAIQQGDSAVASLLSSIFGIVRTVYDTIAAVPRVVRNIRQISAVVDSVHSFVDRIPDFLSLLLDDIVPLITAVHTVFTGDYAFKAVGIASILRIISKFSSQPKQPRQAVLEEFEFDERGFQNLTGARPQGLTDFVPGFSEALGALRAIIKPRSENVGANSYQYVLTAVPEKIFRSILAVNGFILGAGYNTYIRRVCGNADNPDFAYWLRLYWHSLLYMFHGDTLNKEWERTQINSMLDVIAKFDRAWSEKSFETANLTKKCLFSNQTNIEFLERAAKYAIVFRSGAAEFNAPSFVYQSCQRIIDLFAKCSRLAEYRTTQPEPIGIFLGGDPGIGKTLLLSAFLPSFLLPLAGVGKGDPDREVYAVPLGEQKFWDGYDGQPYVLLDELLQERDGADPALVIRAINTMRMPVNKAELSEKGTVFRSHFFGVSSNHNSVSAASQTIHCPEALVRRFPFCFQLTLKKTYRKDNGMLDVTALREAVIKSDNPLQVLDNTWEFKPLNLKTGVSTGGVELFSQIVHRIVEMHNDRKRSHSSILGMCEVMAEAAKLVHGTQQADVEDDADWSKIRIRPIIDDRFCYGDGASKPGTPRTFYSMTDSLDKSASDEDPYPEELNPFECAPPPKRKTSGSRERRPGTGLVGVVADLCDEELTEEACTQAMRVILVMSAEELGCEPEHLKRRLIPGADSPFADEFEVWDLEVPFGLEHIVLSCDKIWKLSRQYQGLSGPKKVFQGILKILAIAGCIGTAVYAIVKLVASLFSQGAKIVDGVAQAYDTVKSSRAKPKVPVVKATGAVPQANEEVFERIRRNLREIYVKSSGDSVMSMQCLALDSKTLLVPDHLYQHHRKNIENGLQSYCFVSIPTSEFERCDVMPIQLGPSNSRLVEMTGSMGQARSDTRVVSLTTEFLPRARDIWHFLYQKEDPRVFDAKKQASVLGHSCCKSPTSDFDVVVQQIVITPWLMDSRFIGTVSSHVSEAGDCGRPYVLKGEPRPIIGIHSFLCDDTKILGATPCYYEDVRAAWSKLAVDVVPVVCEEAKVQFKGPLELHKRHWFSKMECLGVGTFGDVQLRIYTPTDHNYVRVRHRGVLLQHPSWECNFEPAAQRPIGGVHPLLTNMQKYGVNEPVSSVPPAMYFHCLQHYIGKLPRDADRHRLTWHESINGIDGLQPIMLNTSSGYWTLFGFKDGKHQFFDPLEKKYGLDGQELPQEFGFSYKAKTHVVPLYGKSFVDRLEEAGALCENAVAPFTIWTSTVKNELLKREKVEIGKSRVFEQCGLEMTLLFRREFGAFLAWFRTHYGFTLHSGIGADKEVVWAEYARIMRRNSPLGFRYDYANYDGTVMHAGFQFFGDICDAFYGKEDIAGRNARWALLDVLRHSTHLAGDCFFESHSGNKSGNPFTDVFNTITNTLCIYLSYLIVLSSLGESPNLSNFEEQVKFLTYGDDVVGTMRPDIAAKVTGTRVQAVLGHLGYKVTDAMKNAVMEDHCAFEELCFLKSGWRFDGGVWCAPMEKPNIYKEARYRPKKFEYDESDTMARCQVMQRFMAHHGPEELLLFQNQLRERGIPVEWSNYSYGEFMCDMRMKQEGAVLY